MPLTPTLVLPWQRGSSRAERRVCFYFSSSRTKVGAPFLLPSNSDMEPWKNNHETHSSLVALASFSQEERSSSQRRSASHERKKRTMQCRVARCDFLKKESCRAAVCKSTKLASSPSCFTTRRSLIIIIFCTRDRCRTVHCDWKTPCRSSFRRQRQRRYLFYSPLCVVACKGLENRYLCKKSSAVITNAAAAVQSTANANVPPPQPSHRTCTFRRCNNHLYGPWYLGGT